jgi:hypothetical protein
LKLARPSVSHFEQDETFGGNNPGFLEFEGRRPLKSGADFLENVSYDGHGFSLLLVFA